MRCKRECGVQFSVHAHEFHAAVDAFSLRLQDCLVPRTEQVAPGPMSCTSGEAFASAVDL